MSEKLLDRMRRIIRLMHYSLRIVFHGKGAMKRIEHAAQSPRNADLTSHHPMQPPAAFRGHAADCLR